MACLSQCFSAAIVSLDHGAGCLVGRYENAGPQSHHTHLLWGLPHGGAVVKAQPELLYSVGLLPHSPDWHCRQAAGKSPSVQIA